MLPHRKRSLGTAPSGAQDKRTRHEEDLPPRRPRPVVAALATPALAQEPLSVRVAPQFDANQPAVTDTSDFRAAALRSDAVSIESSRIALERSRNPRVRQYAHNVLVERKATTQALLPEGTSLTAGGTVVSDAQPFETRLDNPVGVVLAPVTISATIAQRVVGGVLGGVGLVDNSPSEPGRRVAIGAEGQARIDRLKSAVRVATSTAHLRGSAGEFRRPYAGPLRFLRPQRRQRARP